jgi:hypothetical protein
MAMSPPKELYTAKSLFTLGGASFSVVALTGALSKSFCWQPRWLALVFAELLAFVGLKLLAKDTRRIGLELIAVAFCNGLLIYTQAAGFNAINQGAAPSKEHDLIECKPAFAAAKSASLIPVIDPTPWWTPADQKLTADNMITTVQSVAVMIEDFKESHTGLPPDLVLHLTSWQEQLGYASNNLANSYSKQSTPVSVRIVYLPSAKREDIDNAVNSLRSGGFTVIPPQPAQRGPEVADMRFYHSEDRGSAERAQGIIAKAIGSTPKLNSRTNELDSVARHPLGTLELWLK